ncbi:LysR family transcriptional regulator [bacterium]|nr:LysR family transcriptional regulator [bacterium]
MELRQLKTFRAVANLNSFQQAAQVLHYAQSTVSEQIKILEADLNVKLFKRQGKQIQLTEPGELLLQYAQRMIALEEEIKTEIVTKDKPQGSLTLRIPETLSTYLFPPLFHSFRQQYPKIRLNFSHCSYFSLQQELRSGMIQLGFLITDDPFQMVDLETEVLGSLSLALVSHPGHPLSMRDRVLPQDIQPEPLLLPKEDCSYQIMLHRTLIKNKVQPGLMMNFNSIEVIKRCIMEGSGITIIPKISVEDELQKGRLTQLSWFEDPIRAKVLMIYLKQKWISPNLMACIEMFREMFNGKNNQ